jgi:CubicO group peptidase (beta-lactamase class C family)
MKRQSKLFTGIKIFLLFVVLLMLGLFYYKGAYVFRALRYTYPGIEDYQIFVNRKISPSPKPQEWPLSFEFNQHKLTDRLSQNLKELKAVAFVVIKDDSLLHEQYWEDYGPESHSNSFSVAKSFVGALVGVALKEGKIKSLQQPVGDFLPYLRGGLKDSITIENLLTMSSGLDWDEAYSSLFSITTEAYYGSDLEELMKRQEVSHMPGKYFSYKSGDTQLLSFALKEATGKNLSSYLESKLWHPMGAVNSALWSLDTKGGYEKAYCCLNTNARDFARIGKLYLNKGNWNGNQLIDTSYIEASIRPAAHLYDSLELKRNVDFYGYHWWIFPEHKELGKIYYSRGILGQYVICIPSKNMIVVRLGHERGEPADAHRTDFLLFLDEVAKIF